MKPFERCKILVLVLLTGWLGASAGKPGRLGRIGISFAPEYSYRLLSASERDAWIADLRDDLEVPKFGYTAGFNFAFKVGKKFFFESGAGYSNKGEQTKDADLIYNDPDPEAPVSLVKRYSYGFLEIPAKLNYLLADSTALFAFLGLAIKIPTFEKVKTIYRYADGNKKRDSYHSTHTNASAGVSLTAGIGYFIPLSKMFLLKTAPYLKCSLTPDIKTPIDEYFYSFGIDFGLYISR